VLIGGFVAWPILGFVLLRLERPWPRNLLGIVNLGIGLSLAWVVPEDLPWLRFLVLIPCFAAIGKTWEFCSGKLRNQEMLASSGRRVLWLVVMQNVTWPEGPEATSAARRVGVQVAGRALAKAGVVLALLALNSAISLHHNLWLSTLWMSFFLYFFFSVIIDATSVPFRLAGLQLSEVFNAPPLARNPREFWSRRWNLWFSEVSNLLIFQPLGGVRRPLLGVSAVFVFSALLHEYMVWVALTRPDGRMTAFFLIHGVATIATTMLGKRLGRKTLMPRWVAIPLHIAWFTLTAPLFFGPVEEAFTLSAWQLW